MATLFSRAVSHTMPPASFGSANAELISWCTCLSQSLNPHVYRAAWPNVRGSTHSIYDLPSSRNVRKIVIGKILTENINIYTIVASRKISCANYGKAIISKGKRYRLIHWPNVEPGLWTWYHFAAPTQCNRWPERIAGKRSFGYSSLSLPLFTALLDLETSNLYATLLV